jgi:hypothetical protein
VGFVLDLEGRNKNEKRNHQSSHAGLTNSFAESTPAGVEDVESMHIAQG